MEVIRLDNVSLWRRTQEEFSYDLKKTILSFLQGKYQKPSRKQVLKEINLVVKSGEKIGIIGANGAGKSTLLKVICGILEPTTGQIRVRGNIAPLIELGAGFNVDMSVLDNIITYGVLLGYSKAEMKERIQSILEFAELTEYAEVPVKALSSGMKARLGFSVATDVKPDILILDEVLSVGDAKFKKKSQQRIENLWNHSSTILFVSHSLEYVRELCDRCVWLDRGEIVFYGNTNEAVDHYLQTVEGGNYIGLQS
jgi:ABC-type polysaccharide/polyol phosphate transport system ATPase subunit